MTKEELLRKNAAIIKARAEGKREEQKEEIVQPKKKKGGKKPANREYMVVEDSAIQEEAVVGAVVEKPVVEIASMAEEAPKAEMPAAEEEAI